MDDNDLENFDKFVERHWKKITQKETIPVSAVVGEQPKKRGRKPKIED